ncbi:DUF3467 domain-containing protein [candidate division FCPU426 bacterium]|nr:DUF3467 domain-containing protein [candidate division FCPU426 bacterium]
MGREKNQNQEQPSGMQLQVEMDDATAQGAYSNLALVAHNATEFVMDFIFVQPQHPKAKVRARIISSPGHTKRFLRALADNIGRYEQVFGEIKEIAEAPDARNIKVH